MLRRGAVLVLCAFLGSVRHARGQLSGCSMVKLFGLNSNNTQSRTMGEYVSRPDGGFPVYHSVSQRLSLWYDDKRKAWQVSDGVRDSAGRALLLAHSTAKRADAIAPMGGHWLSLNPGATSNYTKHDEIVTHCAPLCRVVELIDTKRHRSQFVSSAEVQQRRRLGTQGNVTTTTTTTTSATAGSATSTTVAPKHAAATSTRAAVTAQLTPCAEFEGTYVMQYRSFDGRHLFLKINKTNPMQKSYLLYSAERSGWAVNHKLDDSDTQLYHAGKHEDSPARLAGPWRCARGSGEETTIESRCVGTCRRVQLEGLNKSSHLYPYMGSYVLQGKLYQDRPTYMRFGIMWGNRHLQYSADGHWAVGERFDEHGKMKAVLRVRSLSRTGDRLPSGNWEVLVNQSWVQNWLLRIYCVEDDCHSYQSCDACTAKSTCGWCAESGMCTSNEYCAGGWREVCRIRRVAESVDAVFGGSNSAGGADRRARAVFVAAGVALVASTAFVLLGLRRRHRRKLRAADADPKSAARERRRRRNARKRSRLSGDINDERDGLIRSGRGGDTANTNRDVADDGDDDDVGGGDESESESEDSENEQLFIG